MILGKGKWDGGVWAYQNKISLTGQDNSFQVLLLCFLLLFIVRTLNLLGFIMAGVKMGM